MNTNLIALLATLVPMLAFDAVWLSTMAKRFYAPNLGTLMSETPKFLPAGIFYLIYVAGVTVFVVIPSINGNQSLLQTFIYGALFGFVAYATYDLTNQATLRDWPLIVTLVDLAWGTVLTGTVSIIAVSLTKYFS